LFSDEVNFSLLSKWTEKDVVLGVSATHTGKKARPVIGWCVKMAQEAGP
jgi:hypothetical protein